MDKLSGDLLTEILLRLPYNSLAALKCTTRSLRAFISDPYFVNLYSRQAAPNISGLLYLHTYEHSLNPSPGSVHHIPFRVSGISNSTPPHTFLGSSPLLTRHPVSILASCNGVILLCAFDIFFLYNTITSKQRLLSDRFNTRRYWFGTGYMKERFGLVFDPLNFPSSVFKVVNVSVSLSESNAYAFKICSLHDNSCPQTNVTLRCTSTRGFDFQFSNLPVYMDRVLYWLSKTGAIFALDVGKEQAQMIDIPDKITIRSYGSYLDACLGVADGLINLVSVSDGEIAIWALQDHFKWNIKQCIRTRWNYGKALFFNGERFLLGKCDEEYHKPFKIHQYDTRVQKWTTIYTLIGWMMKNQLFVPYVGHWDNTVKQHAPEQNTIHVQE